MKKAINTENYFKMLLFCVVFVAQKLTGLVLKRNILIKSDEMKTLKLSSRVRMFLYR